MGLVRPLVEQDLPAVAELHQHVFGRSLPGSAAYLKQLVFESPWHDAELPSLVYEDERGRLMGCLGVMPRKMALGGRGIRAAVGYHFMVDRSVRHTLAGVELARQFFCGPQHLALAEGNEFSRRIWELCGGRVSHFYSLCWTRPLRPARYALSVLRRRGLSPALACALKPVCALADSVAGYLPQRPFRFPPPATRAEDLDTTTLLGCLSTLASRRALRPVYDGRSLEWLLRVLAHKRHRGRLQKVAVHAGNGRLLGWYLYYLGRSGIAEVVQVGGHEEAIGEVLDHLFYDAWQRGASAASGLIDAALFQPLSHRGCIFHRPAASWMLVHTRDQRILDAIHAGDIFLTRMEGEWWIAS